MIIYKRIYLLILIFCIFQSPIFCNEISFDNFLADALSNSYSLKISTINNQITKKTIKEAKAEYFPIVNAYATTQRYNDLRDSNLPITAVGNEILLNRSYYQDMASVGLGYKVFDNGIRKRQLDIAKADDKQKELLLLKNTKDLKLDIVELYAQALYLYKQLQIKKNTLSLQNELYEIRKRLRKAGELSEIDVVDNEIKIEEIKSQLNTISTNFAKKLADASFYTGKEYDVNDTKFNDFQTVTLDSESNNKISQNADGTIKLGIKMDTITLDESLESKIYDLEILKKKKEYEIQKRANFPKFQFDTRYNLYGSDPSSFSDSINDISQTSISFRLSTSFVLFDGFKNINTINKKKMEIEKVKISKEEKLAQLKKEYQQIQLDSKNAILQAESNAKTLELVDKNLNMLERLNTSGTVDKITCINKKLELLDKKLELEQNQIKIFVDQYKYKILSNEDTNL